MADITKIELASPIVTVQKYIYTQLGLNTMRFDTTNGEAYVYEAARKVWIKVKEDAVGR